MAFDNLIPKGTTSKIIEITLRDSTTGQGKTGVAHGDVTASYCREGSTRTAITLAAGTVGDSYSSGKWAEVDNTNMPGLYQLHVPNAAIATGVNSVTLQLKTSGAIDKVIRIGLTTVDAQSTSFGLTLAKTTNITGFNDLSEAQVKTQVDTGLSDVGLTTTITGRIDVATSTRMASFTLPTNFADLSISASTGLVNISQTAADKVWDTSTRLLTAGTNIVLAKGVGVTGFNDLSAAAVNAEVDTALADYDGPTNAEMVARTLPAADYALEATLTAIKGGSWSIETLKAIYDLVGTRLATVGYTTPPTVGAIADAVWDEDIADHDDVGSTGEAVILISDNTVDIKAKTDNLPSDPADASDITNSFTTVNNKLDTIDDFLDTEVLAIKAKTDNLPASPAAVGSAMTLTSGERTAIANEVEAQIIDDTDSEKVLEAITDKIASVNPSLGDLSLAAISSAVWSESTRTLTSGTNIVLAKGTGITGFNDLSAAQVNSEVDAALADVGLTTTVTGRIDAAITTRMATFTLPTNFSTLAINGSGYVTATNGGGATAEEIAEAVRDIDNTAPASNSIGAAINSRAAASTALSTVVWTDILASRLSTFSTLKRR